VQRRILWAGMRKETGRWKSRWTVRDLLADGRCGQAVLDFLSFTDVRRLVEIRWCPAHEGVAGNEKADEWAKTAAEQSGSHRPIPRSLANLKREISKQWMEARQWAGGRTSKRKYRMPQSQRPDGTVAGSNKRLASRFYQLKTGHCLTGQCLSWTKNRPTPQCWWCRYRTQTRDHLFKECPKWKLQQKILLAEAKKETGRWKD